MKRRNGDDRRRGDDRKHGRARDAELPTSALEDGIGGRIEDRRRGRRLTALDYFPDAGRIESLNPLPPRRLARDEAPTTTGNALEWFPEAARFVNAGGQS